MVIEMENPIEWLKEQVTSLWAQIKSNYATVTRSISEVKTTLTELSDMIENEVANRKSAITGILDSAKDAAETRANELIAPLGITVDDLGTQIKDQTTWINTISTDLLARLKAIEDIDLKSIPGKITDLKDDIEAKIKGVREDIKGIKDTLTDPETFINFILSALEKVW